MIGLGGRGVMGFGLGRGRAGGPCAGLDWRTVGAAYWPRYAACMATTIAAGGSSIDTLSTPSGTYPGNYAFAGGVLLPDGRVFCVPYYSATARIYANTSAAFDSNVLLSAYYNKL